MARKPGKRIEEWEFRTKTLQHKVEIRLDTKDGNFYAEFNTESFREKELSVLKHKVKILAESNDNTEFAVYIRYRVCDDAFHHDKDYMVGLDFGVFQYGKSPDGTEWQKDVYIDRRGEIDIHDSSNPRRYHYKWHGEKLIPYTPERLSTLLGIQKAILNLKLKLRELLETNDTELAAHNFNQLSGFSRLLPPKQHDDEDEIVEVHEPKVVTAQLRIDPEFAQELAVLSTLSPRVIDEDDED